MSALGLYRPMRYLARAEKHGLARVSLGLAVGTFAVTTTCGLTVLGGLCAFIRRAQTGASTPLVPMAVVASVLLGVCLLELIGAGMRFLSLGHRSRLAALHLAGATERQLTFVAAVDGAALGAAGAAIGAGGYVVLLPLVTLLRFAGTPFTPAQLWVGPVGIAAGVAGVVAMTMISQWRSVHRLSISTMGTTIRHRSPSVRDDVVLAAIGVAATPLAIGLPDARLGTVIFVLGIVAVGGAILNASCPPLLAAVGRAVAALSSSGALLLAGRRITAHSRDAWRHVRPVSVTAFAAGIVFLVVSAVGGTSRSLFVTDMVVGAAVTLGFASALVGASTGFRHSARILEDRDDRRLHLTGSRELRQLDKARVYESVIPLAVILVLQAAGMGLLTLVVEPSALAGAVVPFIAFLVCVMATTSLGAALPGLLVRQIVSDAEAGPSSPPMG